MMWHTGIRRLRFLADGKGWEGMYWGMENPVFCKFSLIFGKIKSPMVFPDYCYTSASSLKSATTRLYGSENRVGTACAKCRVKREMVHQMRGDILYA